MDYRFRLHDLQCIDSGDETKMCHSMRANVSNWVASWVVGSKPLDGSNRSPLRNIHDYPARQTII